MIADKHEQWLEEVEQEKATAIRKTAFEEAAKLAANEHLLEIFIGPLYNMGWNAAIAHVAARIREL